MERDFLIRDAVLSDSPALTRLNREEMGYDFPEQETASQLKKLLADGRNKILVAQSQDRLLGYVHLVDYDLLYNAPMKNIMGIAVCSDCRRTGVGAALLRAAEDWARETGAEGIRLVSGETRTGAHAFYRSQGYEGSKMQLNLKKKF